VLFSNTGSTMSCRVRSDGDEIIENRDQNSPTYWQSSTSSGVRPGMRACGSHCHTEIRVQDVFEATIENASSHITGASPYVLSYICQFLVEPDLSRAMRSCKALYVAGVAVRQRRLTGFSPALQRELICFGFSGVQLPYGDRVIACANRRLHEMVDKIRKFIPPLSHSSSEIAGKNEFLFGFLTMAERCSLVTLFEKGSITTYSGLQKPCFDGTMDQKATHIRTWLSENNEDIRIIALVDLLLPCAPRVIFQLPRLRVLTLRNVGLNGLPEKIDLPCLYNLDLGGNQLTTLPETARALTQLRAISIRNNRFTSVPKPLEDLHQLTSLLLGENALDELPQFCSKFSRLQILDVQQTPLSRFEYSSVVPEEFRHLLLHSRLLVSECVPSHNFRLRV